MKAVTDEQLIQWVAAGDPSCLATLFERHHRGVYRYFMRMLRDRTLCEDLVQDVFLKILRKAAHFRSEGSFKGWMFNIARNVALDHVRKAGRRDTTTIDDVGGDEGAAAHLTDHRSAEQAATATEKTELVLQAMAALPAAVQEVIWLGRFELDSYEELGQALNCSAATARVRMHRAMGLLSSTYESVHGAAIDV